MAGTGFAGTTLAEDAAGKDTAKRPRIILLMQFYDPEPVYKGQAFAEAVAEAGYDVEVVTGFPNYPGGRIYDGFRIRPLRRTSQNGISITRLALFPSQGKSRTGRALNYLSFLLSAFLYLTLAARRANLVYAYHPPLTVGLAATGASLFRRTPFVVDIHDLWPDTLPATGMVANPAILWTINLACNWMYARAGHIILHSHGMCQRLHERGVPSRKMTTITGWTQEAAHLDGPGPPPRSMQDLPGLKILFAGNIGPAQNLEAVIGAAHLLEQQGSGEVATFCILGSGVALTGLKDRTRALGLRNVVFLPRVAPSDVGAYLTAAEVLLVHLRDDPLFAITIPSKLQAYMLAGKPILLGVRGDAARLVADAGCGLTVTPGQPAAIAAATRTFAGMTTGERAALGGRARAYYWRELSMCRGMRRFLDIFEQTRRQ